MAQSSAHQARLQFLNDSAHLMAIASPTTSAVLGAQRDKLLEWQNDDIQASSKEWDAHRREVCGACGNIMIPGWSCKVAQESMQPKGPVKAVKGKNRSSTEIEKVMVYSCLRCHRKTTQPIKIKPVKHLKRSRAVQMISTVDSKAADAPSQTPKSANANSKKRAKARKQGGLQAMLAKSKSQPSNSQKGGFGLDLLDLMKTD